MDQDRSTLGTLSVVIVSEEELSLGKPGDAKGDHYDRFQPKYGIEVFQVGVLPFQEPHIKYNSKQGCCHEASAEVIDHVAFPLLTSHKHFLA